MSSYSDLPPAPPSSEHTPARNDGPRPDTVTNAVRLMFLQVLIGVITLIVLFATKDDFEKRIREDTPTASQSTIDAAIVVAVVFGVVFTVLYALLAVQVGRGRNWARIVTWVLAGLGIASGLVSFGQPEPPASRVLGIVGLVVDVALVVLLALAASNRYFKRRV